MTILSFYLLSGTKTVLINPQPSIINYAVNTYPTAKMTVIDFKANEVVIFVNDCFSWKEESCVINLRLSDFSNNNNVMPKINDLAS